MRHHHVVDASSNIQFIFFKTACMYMDSEGCVSPSTHPSPSSSSSCYCVPAKCILCLFSNHSTDYPFNRKVQSVIDNRLLFGFFCNIFAQMTAENDAPSNDEQKAKKRKERLEQNRISARESRKRKKTMIEELQRYIFLWKEVLLCLACSHTDFILFFFNRTVITLSRENKELNDTNASLRKQLVELASKVCILYFFK